MGLLVLERKEHERVRLEAGGVLIWVVVVEAERGRAKLAFRAPPEVRILREEVVDRLAQQGQGEQA
jgi:carbon storage regulator CsrA